MADTQVNNLITNGDMIYCKYGIVYEIQTAINISFDFLAVVNISGVLIPYSIVY